MQNKYSIQQLENMWQEFANIPINEDEEIEEDFYLWKVGTDRMDIWHWFDDQSKGIIPPRF